VSYEYAVYPARLLSGRPGLALGGGGGLGRVLVHLIIWRLIWRAGLALWRVPTFGPPLAIVLGITVVALIIIRSHRGPGWWKRGGGSSGGRTHAGRGDGGPRDW
jgi:hypothetical protein